jgi:hypothetical protein
MARRSTALVARLGGPLAALAGVAVALLVLAGTAAAPNPAEAAKGKPTPAPTATPTPAPDFWLSTNYGAGFAHYLIRGETWDPHPLCDKCVTYSGPHVKSDSYGCFFDANSIGVVSRNGFSGTVDLAILGLPSGVISRTAASLTVRSGTSPAANTGFALEAGTGGALGTFTATIQGTSGSIRHTVDLPITVVDQLPPC